MNVMTKLSRKQNEFIENCLNACQIRLTAKLMDVPIWFVPLQGILQERVYFQTQLSLIDEVREWFIQECNSKHSPSISSTEENGIRNLKIGRWYKNKNHNSMKYGRISEIKIVPRDGKENGIQTFYNSITFDKCVSKNDILSDGIFRQSNRWMDDEMMEVNAEFIKDKYG